MKRTIVAATAAALIASGITAEAAKNRVNPATKCATPRGETLVGSGDVRVFTADRKDTREASRTAIVACRYKTGKSFLLGVVVSPFDDDSDAASRYIRDISISNDYGDGVGPGVAYVVANCKASCDSHVIVKSLRKGKVVMNKKAGSPFDQIALSQPTDQGGFALAWLETSAGGTCEQGCRIHLLKNSGDKVVAEGTDIDSDVFGLLDDESFGIVAASGTNSFVYKIGDTVRLANFND
jgi:hypothetical protein